MRGETSLATSGRFRKHHCATQKPLDCSFLAEDLLLVFTTLNSQDCCFDRLQCCPLANFSRECLINRLTILVAQGLRVLQILSNGFFKPIYLYRG
jgi:hypothetical protein